MYVFEKFADTGLFQTMETRGVLPDDFISLIGLSSEEIDLLYYNVHGTRTLARIGRTLNIEELADLIGKMFKTKWSNALELYLKENDYLKGDKEVITENITDDNQTTDERTNTSQVSAYNDDDFVNNDKNDSLDTINTDNKRDRLLTRYNLKLSDVEKLRNLLQNNFLYDIIFVDVNTVLTLSIY